MTTVSAQQPLARKSLPGGLTLLLLAFFIVSVAGFPAPLRGQGLPETVVQNDTVFAPSLTSAQETVALASLILKVIGSLGLVLLLLLLFLLLLKKFGMDRLAARNDSLINVVTSRMLGPKKHITLLEVGGEFFLLAVTEQRINLLARLENSEELQKMAGGAQDLAPPGAVSFISLLNRARGRRGTDLKT